MISMQQLTKSFQTPAGTFIALDNIDLEIQSGEFVGLIGKSGSGKSTLLNMLGGIDRPTSGTISIRDTQLQSLTENKLASWRGKNIGFVFQFFQLLPTLTAAENVMLPMDFCKAFPAGERRARAVELLEKVGVGPQADKLPSTLSGGEQQRVAIARALANDPSVVLADEPTGNLDSVTAHSILDLFREMASSGRTVVIATHETDISRVIDRTLHLADGRFVS
jgi:putative ABC transport system ATP-binding protein